MAQATRPIIFLDRSGAQPPTEMEFYLEAKFSFFQNAINVQNVVHEAQGPAVVEVEAWPPYITWKEPITDGGGQEHRMSLTIADQRAIIHARRFLDSDQGSFARIAAYLMMRPEHESSASCFSVQAIAFWYGYAQYQNNSASLRIVVTKEEHWKRPETDGDREAILEKLDEGWAKYEEAFKSVKEISKTQDRYGHIERPRSRITNNRKPPADYHESRWPHIRSCERRTPGCLALVYESGYDLRSSVD